ncbi:MAG: hypothetical protein RL642_333, partial [Bacteroidota bacterium]
MKYSRSIILSLSMALFLVGKSSCKKKEVTEAPVNNFFQLEKVEVDGSLINSALTRDVSRQPKITLTFSAPIDKSKAVSSIILGENTLNRADLNFTYLKSDSVLIISPAQPLKGLTKYQFNVATSLTAANGATLNSFFDFNFHTVLDST